MSDTKFCHRCKMVKSFSDFHKAAGGVSGLQCYCKSCIAEYYSHHKVDKALYDIVYRKNNRDRINCRKRVYENKRRRTDPEFKLIRNMRNRVWYATELHCNSQSTKDLIGCSALALRNWLSYQFEEGMNWNNYGEWHIDHVIPCASFNLEDPEQQKICHHWTNLQPLWAVDNLRKGDKYEQL